MRGFLYRLVYRELERLGADGLVNEDAGCGCGLDDLVPGECCPDLKECIPARKRVCRFCERAGDCSFRIEYDVEECFVPLDIFKE